MRAATIRRCLVFGVCAVGVGALYLVPSLGRSPYPVSQPRPNDEPTTQPTPTPTGSISTVGRRTTAVKQPTRPADPQPTSSTTPEVTIQPTAEASTAPRTRPASRGATPYDPDDGSDNEPPQPVQKITPTKVTADQLTLNWPEAHDNVRVIGYHVWLSGFQVASTAETHATVPWFNDDTAQHVVQVKAVDAAGNEAPTSPSLLVSRPDPDSSESPQPTDAPSTDPAPPPSASAEPSESTRIAPSEQDAQSVATTEAN